MIDIWRLQLLVQFYNLKTMRKVAKAANVSPAAVSAQLKALEDETNSILFEKQGRNVKLTEAGLNLVQQAQPILDQLEQLNNNFQNTSHDVQGSVRIVSFDSAIRTIVLPAVSKLKLKYPQIKITITEKEPEQALTGLNAHQFDLAVVAKFESDEFINNNPTNKIVELGSDRLKVLMSVDNPLANGDKTSASITELKNQNWILEPDNAYISKYIERAFVSANLHQKIMGVFQSYVALQVAVSDNLAIGVLPELALVPPMNRIKVIDLDPQTNRHIYLVKRRPQASIPVIKIVSEAIQEQAQLLFNRIHK